MLNPKFGLAHDLHKNKFYFSDLEIKRLLSNAEPRTESKQFPRRVLTTEKEMSSLAVVRTGQYKCGTIGKTLSTLL